MRNLYNLKRELFKLSLLVLVIFAGLVALIARVLL